MDTERVVIVTGGASGIGLGICKLFTANGHPVAMLDMQEEALRRESGALRAGGARVLACVADVSSRASIDAAYVKVRAELGPISIVIANAGISMSQDFLSMTLEAWDRMIAVNLTGVFHTLQAAVPDMVTAKWGRIVTISSQAAQSGAPDRAHYAAAKGGVIGLTRALARELARHGITVNTIPPSLVDTPLAREGERTAAGCRRGRCRGSGPPSRLSSRSDTGCGRRTCVAHRAPRIRRPTNRGPAHRHSISGR
jgi:NAD(P)-dependent dehydrogenase (short-subunit alcohol dehydrogenase family)